MSRRARRPMARRYRPLSARWLLVIGLLALAVVTTALLGVPAGFWREPGPASFRQDLLVSFGLATPEPQASPPPSGDQPWFQVYFTAPIYPDDPSRRPEAIDRHLVQLIDQARQSVDVAAYELDLQTVADALLRARERGVTVRVVTDADNLHEDAIRSLQEGGIPVRADGRAAIMHNKFVVVDGEYVLTGSWNLTVNCTYRNNNNAIIIRSPDLAQNYRAEFAEMFEQGQFGPRSPRSTPFPEVTVHGTRIETCFSPEDRPADAVARAVGRARRSIRFMAFSFTDETLAQAMIERARDGVDVSGVIEKRGSETAYGQLVPLREAGIPVLADGNPYVMHHKVIIIDGETVITGSFNFTGSAARDNDENLLIIHNADIARLYLEEYERVRQVAAQAAP
ncbi:MAG: phospholipase [Anaerolineae bacterium]|nr:phospholipase [Anaerolineae bacterium]